MRLHEEGVTRPKYGTVMSTSNIETFYQGEAENKAKFNRYCLQSTANCCKDQQQLLKHSMFTLTISAVAGFAGSCGVL
jgi:hypothetical protein